MTRTGVTLLTVGDPQRVTGGYLFHRRLAERAHRHGAEVTFVSIPDVPLPWAIATGPVWLRSPAMRTADVLVLDSLAATAAAPWLSRIAAPVVGMLHQPPGGMDAHRLARSFRTPFDRRAYRACRLLMVASEWLADQLAAARVPRAKLRVVSPGKDLDAVARLPDQVVTLHLVGDTSTRGPYARRVRERVEQPDLRERVVVHGLIPSAAVERMYRAADAFVLPSFEEPYGTVWGEAMAAGLPVVGWHAGNLPFLADHGTEGMLVGVGDVPALGAAMEQLARDPGLRARMGRAARRRAAARPTWDETAARFFGIIEEVRSRHSGGDPRAG